jgi:anti-anti-sigma factor
LAAVYESEERGARRDDMPVTLVVTGELCHYSAPRLLGPLVERANGSTELVLDLEGVTFVDAGGLTMFVALAAELAEHGGQLRLGPISASARRTLAIGGLVDPNARCGASLTRLRPAPITAAPTNPAPDAPRLEIHYLEAGGLILVTVHGDLSDDTKADVERRVLRLIDARQPRELRLDLGSKQDPFDATSLAAAVQRAAEQYGGRGVVAGWSSSG